MQNLDIIKNLNFDNNKRTRQTSINARTLPDKKYEMFYTAPSPGGQMTEQVRSAKYSVRNSGRVTSQVKADRSRSREKSVKSSAKGPMTLSASVLYDEASHKKPNGYYYDSTSTKVPRYYNRAGPASYQPDRTLASDS